MSVGFFFGGTDAGGIRIVRGADGSYHIVRVPGWNPEFVGELVAAATAFQLATHIKDKAIAGKFEAVAQRVVADRSPELDEYLQGSKDK